MDNTVENGYKCVLCLRRLASKYSLERHIRLKHKSSKAEVVDYSNPPNIDVDIVKKGIDIEQESDNDTELDNNNNIVYYATSPGSRCLRGEHDSSRARLDERGISC